MTYFAKKPKEVKVPLQSNPISGISGITDTKAQLSVTTAMAPGLRS